tara:strand:- start:3613 stop:4182 length:570 start_codon:yes stop_codon:yes gene_type:complete
MISLGLDVSTSCTGWAIFDESGKFSDMGTIVLSKIPDLYEKAQKVRDSLQDILSKNKVDSIYIEENLQSFRAGFSSARTLSTLSRFNGMVSLISYEVFSVKPEHINVNAARKSLGIKLVRKKDGGAPTKEQVLNWVDNDLRFIKSSYLWPLKVLRGGPRKGQEILDPVAYDMADAYVICKSGIVLNRSC